MDRTEISVFLSEICPEREALLRKVNAEISIHCVLVDRTFALMGAGNHKRFEEVAEQVRDSAAKVRSAIEDYTNHQQQHGC